MTLNLVVNVEGFVAVNLDSCKQINSSGYAS